MHVLEHVLLAFVTSQQHGNQQICAMAHAVAVIWFDSLESEKHTFLTEGLLVKLLSVKCWLLAMFTNEILTGSND